MIPFLLLLAIFAASMCLGFLVGIVPGLLLGIPGWHREGAFVLPLVGMAISWGTRWPRIFGDMRFSLETLLLGAGLGMFGSIWFFGSLTA